MLSFDSYQRLAMRTRGVYKSTNDQLICGSLGLSGETGEFIDKVKKILYHSKEIPSSELKAELGDIIWYLALISDSLGFTLSDIANENIMKLEKRYPNGFNFIDANKSRSAI